MYKPFFFLSALCLSAFSLQAQTEVTVKQALLAGPYPVQSPILADSTDVNGQAFDTKNLLKANLSTDRALADARTVDLSENLSEKSDGLQRDFEIDVTRRPDGRNRKTS